MDLQNYKVIYRERVYNCVECIPCFRDGKEQPVNLEVWFIDEDGTLKRIEDETWCFQFVPRASKK